MNVAIYYLDKGFSIWMWLCTKHLSKRKREGWEMKERKKAPHQLTCDDCKAAQP